MEMTTVRERAAFRQRRPDRVRPGSVIPAINSGRFAFVRSFAKRKILLTSR
jgi:hypothetical protein